MSNKARSRKRKENKKLIMIELFKTCLIYKMSEIQ